MNNINTTDRKAWPEYNLSTQNIVHDNGQPSRFQVIKKNDKIVAFFTKAYHVLPNEEALKLADDVAKQIGAEPAHMDQANGWFKSSGHVVFSNDGYKMTSYYQFDDKVDVTGGGDFVQKGFSVSNSIDGSSGFRVAPTDVRTKCNNIMMHLYRQQSLGEGVFEKVVLAQDEILAAGMENLKSAQQDWQKLPKMISKPHVKSLTTSFVVDAIKDIKKIADKVMARYKEMYQLKLEVDTARRIVEELPKVITKQLDFIKVVDKEIRVADKVTEWEAFNDISKILTFGKLTYRSTLENYRRLDQILVRV